MLRGTIRLIGPSPTSDTLPARAAKDLGLADGLAFGEQQPRFERAIAPFQQSFAFVAALLVALESVDHDDQPPVVLDRRADEAVAAIGR